MSNFKLRYFEITQTTFIVLLGLGHPNNSAEHRIKLNYKEYSQYAWYDIGRNKEFMAILNYYISKAEQQN